ncbi:hypothetical protein C7M84_023216 [Penaeus vannamei]|uniref:Death domain-containing protein n=1 Tax=Penaeus vannamei TaxID=6689 RepID=A0A3R7PEE5_PENVA|nr:hypothetical protein C7M84_023216 [Penaeus vannamei]
MEFTNLKQEICATWLQLNSEQMAQIRITLLELSSSVSHEIPRMREITRCSDFASSLRLLEKWKLLTPLKVDVILLLTDQVGSHTEMVREKVHQYKKLSMPSHPPVPQGLDQRRSIASSNHVANSRLDQVYEYISENHNGRWADIGRSLGLSSLVSELQREPGLRQKDKVYQLLEEYNRNIDVDPVPVELFLLHLFLPPHCFSSSLFTAFPSPFSLIIFLILSPCCSSFSLLAAYPSYPFSLLLLPPHCLSFSLSSLFTASPPPPPTPSSS